MSAHRDLEQVEQDVTKFARAVALKRATITGIAAGGLAFAAGRGWITPDLSNTARDLIQDSLGLAGVIGAGAWIHTGTTPADQALQPKNSDGANLVPDPELSAAVQAMSGENSDPELAAAVLAMDHVAQPGADTDPPAGVDDAAVIPSNGASA